MINSHFLERLSVEKRRLLLFVALAILATGLLVGASIGYTAYLSAKQYLAQVYITTAQSHSQAIENQWNRFTSIADQFTSRTEIRKKLEAYHQQQITLAELQAYSQPRLQEPVHHVEDLAAMIRVYADGSQVAVIGDMGDDFAQTIGNPSTGVAMICHQSSAHPYVRVVAPIFSQEFEEIGQDILYFYSSSLIPLLKQFGTFTTDQADIYIVNLHSQRALTLDSNEQVKPVTLTEHQISLITTHASLTNHKQDKLAVTSIFIPLEHVDGWGLLVTLPQSVFYQAANQDLNWSIWAIIFLLIIGVLLANLFINPLISRLIKQAEQIERSAVELQLAASVFNKSNEAILITDQHFNIVRVSPGFSRSFDVSAQAILDHNLLNYILHDNQHTDRQIDLKQVQQHLEQHEAWHGEVWYQYANKTLPILQNISLVRHDESQVTYYIHSFNEISEQKHYEQEMHKLAHFDTLTGLPNRLSLHNHIDRMVQEANPELDQFSLLFIDLDKFKPINDTYGHQMGDKLLIEVAQRINQLKRKAIDMSGRLAGDEFLLIIQQEQGESYDYVDQIAQNLVTSLSTVFVIDGIELFIGASIGIACYPKHGMDSTTLIEAADQAMYHAKHNGRNQFYRAPDSQ